MKKFWYFTAICLIAIGVIGALAIGQKSDGDLPSFEKKWTFSASDLRNLHVVSDYPVNISFVKSTDGQNSIHLNGSGTEKMIEKAMATEISDQSLKLDLTRLPKKYINFFDFNFSNQTKEELVISVTDDSLLEKLKVSLDSGNITVTDAALVQISSAELSTDSGNITLDHFKSNYLNLDADSGNIKGNHVTAELVASTDSGNITLENMTGSTNISVDSGNVKLYKLDTSDTDISVDSGNAYVQVPSSFAGSYDLKVDSGNINAPESKHETNEFVKIRTDSGNIKVEQQQ
ncbi:DUF4097 family beta strand repeat-containing protein [Cohnella sp. WQ 127256]|uniref:DUF4097 family beta strand repeat-containing protein n=1 Tax=Cohnella sp. WQ 127256 TaxID=2938790 RepID=UPI0021187579|nr:DUF4097 family beta strand repeat-containing protein [Cohnella sp. WQ 127256]